MKYLQAFLMSLGMFTVLPVPKNSWKEKLLPLMLPSLPLVGLVTGLLWAAAYSLFIYFELPFMLRAAFLSLAPLALSGFLHMDGYMDTADAVCSRREPDERRRILKDPNAGAFAVIAAICLVMLQFSAVCALAEGGLNPGALWLFIFIPAVSRGAAALSLLRLKTMSATGFAAAFRKDTTPSHSFFVIFLSAVCLAAAFYVLGMNAVWPLMIELFAAIVTARYLNRQFEGFSGDLCGCVIVVSEAAALVVAACIH